MATAKSDEDSDVSSHPLAENRPGVYVQVMAPHRRKKGKRGDAAGSSRPPKASTKKAPGAAPLAPDVSEMAAPTAGPLPAPDAPTAAAGFEAVAREREPAVVAQPAVAQPRFAEDNHDDDGRQSGERPVDFDSMRAREAASENTNHTADLLRVSIPPPPRLPSFTHGERDIATDPPLQSLHSASLLDAPHSLRPGPESTPAARPSLTLLAFVAAFSAIIVSAGLVALRELTQDKTPSALSAPLSQASRVSAQRDARPQQAAHPRVEQLPEKPESALPSAAPEEPMEAREALPLPANGPLQRPVLAPHARAHVPARVAASRPPVARAAAGAKKVGQGAPSLAAPTESVLAADEEGPLPEPDEPLELPVNPYR